MARGCPLAPLVLTDDQRDRLTSLSRSISMSHGLVQRARIVLACAEDLSNKAAERLRVAQTTVSKERTDYWS